MRPLVLVLAFLALSAPAFAQNNTTTNETPPGNETPPVNESVGNETAPEEPVAEPEPAGPIEIVLEGVQEGNSFYFRDASGARNPTITVQPGQQVTFKFTSAVGFHNLNVGGLVKTALVSDGDSAPDLVWTAPSEPQTIEYWCDPHKGNGMKGTIRVGAAEAPAEGGEEGAITGETVDLGQYDAACAGKVAPAIVTTGITGSPTLDDYIAKCKPQAEGAGDESHPADYVIPLSWLVIGLGVVGVVWVHKYYKP